MIKRGDQVYKAPNLALIQEWARLGKVSPKDYIYFPKLKKWLSVSSAPSLMTLIPKAIKESIHVKPHNKESKKGKSKKGALDSSTSSNARLSSEDHLQEPQNIKENQRTPTQAESIPLDSTSQPHHSVDREMWPVVTQEADIG